MLWHMISCFVKHNHVHRSTKRNNQNYNDKTTPFESSHTVILKTWRRVNIKIQNSTKMAITVMKSSQKLTKWRIWLPFPKDKDKYLAEDQKGWLKPVNGQVHSMAWLGDTLALFLLWKSRKFSLIWLKLFSACTKS